MTRREIAEALEFFLIECKELKRIYEKAIKLGATQITIPLNIGETGDADIPCCNKQTIELTIHEHMIWACPICSKVWAIRNMAASAEGEE